MADSITKKDLESILDTKLDAKLEQYQKAIIEAVDFEFKKLDGKIDTFEETTTNNFGKVENEIIELRNEIRRLTVTLDNFLKKITDYDDELTLVKGDIKQIKKVIKEKFGIEISAVGW